MLIAVLVAVLLQRLIDYEEYAEKTAVELTVRNLRSALRWQTAQRMIHSRTVELAGLAGANPIPWLERPPAGYLGELAGATSAVVSGGSWYFDLDSRELVYVPNLNRHLVLPPGAVPQMRWQVRVLKSSMGRDVNGPVEGLALAETGPHRWF
ncbi:MAG: hypothetical protein MZV65_40170 [Chromatiales bacterium]|nr:hypothetical protein [Chromatiales bacterium]